MNKVCDTMTAQEVFDAAVTHLFTMPRRASDGVACRYRTKDGNKCLVGALIRDDEYRHTMEHMSIDDIPLPPRLQPHLSLLRDLQGIHDGDYWGVWTDNGHGPLDPVRARKAIANLAKRHGLTVPAIAA